MNAFRGLVTTDGEVIRTSLDITRYLLKTARVAVSPCHSGGIDDCIVRLAFGDLAAAATYAASAARERRFLERLIRDSRHRTRRSDHPPGDGRSDAADLSEGRRVLRVALAERMAPALAALKGAASSGTDAAGAEPRGVERSGAAGYARMQQWESTATRVA